jgi:hypothetical protein
MANVGSKGANSHGEDNKELDLSRLKVDLGKKGKTRREGISNQ